MVNRLFILLCLCVVASPAWAGGLLIGSGVNAPPSSCNTSENEVGGRTFTSTNYILFASNIFIYPATADCTGNLNTANFYHSNIGQSHGKICVYNRANNSSPPAITSTDSLIACTEDIDTGLTVGYKTAIMSGSVTSGGMYWIAMFMVNDYSTRYAAGGTGYYRACDSTCYASPPANLGTGWDTATGYGQWDAFVTIGD